jgi:hypothetical protein
MIQNVSGGGLAEQRVDLGHLSIRCPFFLTFFRAGGAILVGKRLRTTFCYIERVYRSDDGFFAWKNALHRLMKGVEMNDESSILVVKGAMNLNIFGLDD